MFSPPNICLAYNRRLKQNETVPSFVSREYAPGVEAAGDIHYRSTSGAVSGADRTVYHSTIIIAARSYPAVRCTAAVVRLAARESMNFKAIYCASNLRTGTERPKYQFLPVASVGVPLPVGYKLKQQEAPVRRCARGEAPSTRARAACCDAPSANAWQILADPALLAARLRPASV